MDIKVYSVGEISRQVKLLLEDSFPALWVEGEVSNFRPHHSGHLYFTLKDQDAQISCVMWRSRASSISLEMRDGLQIRVYGTIRVYEKAGRYQLDLLRVLPAGLGDLQLQFERLKQKLADEGLFDSSLKKELPPYPKKIGVITSPTGAAIEDILSIAKRRSPSTEIILYGVKVQGDGAAKEIAAAIDIFNAHVPVDILIVGRGGGSLEDLWAFNEESVARAVYRSHIPIISAVGHEIDFTIIDFVADFRAPTPSVAAEMAFPDDSDLRHWLNDMGQSLSSKITQNISHLRKEIINIQKSYAFRRPKDILQQKMMQIEELTQRLQRAGLNQFFDYHKKVEGLQNRINSLNPENVLNRGYAMVLKEGIPVSSIKKVSVDDRIDIKLKDGQIISKVLDKNHGK
jgi:exodeoxyribonuclease VII large subunit